MTSSDLRISANMSAFLKHFMLAVTFVLSTVGGYAQSQYPDWFLHPQRYPDLLVGFSTAGVLSAEEDAIWRYSFLKQGFLFGTASYFNVEDQWEKKYITEAQSPLLEKTNLKKLDRLTTSMYAGGEEIAVFARSDGQTPDPANFHLEFCDQVRPEWVQKGPFYREDGNLYGVGQYVLRANVNDAWRTAEERALIELATVVGVDVTNYITSRDPHRESYADGPGGETISILTYTFDHDFSDAQVLERWINYPDPEQHTLTYIYVLMKVDSNNIKHNLKSKP